MRVNDDDSQNLDDNFSLCATFIDKVYPFEQAKQALAYLEEGRAKGKVVVQMK